MLTSCPLFDNGTRFGCAAANASYTDPSLAAAPQQLRIDRRYIFVGDSVTDQLARHMACLAIGGRGRETTRALSVSGAVLQLKCRHHHQSSSNSSSCADGSGGGTRGRRCGGGAVCYLRAGEERKPFHHSVGEVCEALLPQLRRRDVLVVNEGVWCGVAPATPLPLTPARGVPRPHAPSL